MKNIIRILLLVLLLSPFFVSGQGKGIQGIFSTDNDYFGIGNKDENYTGGLKVEFSTPEIIKWLPFFKFKLGEKSLTINRFGIGGTAYTPQDLLAVEPVVGDRPYASLVFVNIGNSTYIKKNGTTIQSDLIIGAIGTSLPGNAQSHIHEHHWLGTDRPIPMGWDNQIGFNGSLILNYNVKGEGNLWKGYPENRACKFGQVRATGAMEIGNYTVNVRTGVKINILNVNSGLMQDYSPGVPGAGFLDNGVPVIEPKAVRLSFYAWPELRLVGYNATLEGLMFSDHSIYKIEHSQINRAVLDFSLGVNLLLYDRLYIKYALYTRSQEFSGGKNFHSWGGLSIGYSPASWNRS